MKTKICWYKHLYLSPSLEDMKRVVRYEIKYKKVPIGYYLLTLPSTPNNLFDIWRSEQIHMPWMKNQVLDVVGVAASKEEACEMAASIIYETFKVDETVNVKAYLGYK